MARDQYAICSSCGIQFVWTVAEQSGGQQRPELCPGCRYLSSDSGRRRGVVKFFNARKGWGFITQPDGDEIFVHRSALPADLASLSEGDLVEYRPIRGGRGMQAVDVVLLPEAVQDPEA